MIRYSEPDLRDYALVLLLERLEELLAIAVPSDGDTRPHADLLIVYIRILPLLPLEQLHRVHLKRLEKVLVKSCTTQELAEESCTGIYKVSPLPSQHFLSVIFRLMACCYFLSLVACYSPWNALTSIGTPVWCNGISTFDIS